MPQLIAQPPSAHAVLNSPNARIARSAEAALRRSIPSSNDEVKEVRDRLESLNSALRIPQRKPYGSMAKDVATALSFFTPEDRPRLLAGVPPSQVQEADELLTSINSTLKQVEFAVNTQQADYVGVKVSGALKLVAQLELLQAPGLPYIIPKEYLRLPRLAGRAVVELQVERGDGSRAFSKEGGGMSSSATIQITADGFSAPLSAGAFVSNVLEGAYNNRVLEQGSVFITAPTPPNIQKSPIPLEVFPLGEFAPTYRLPLDVQGGELPVLPLSIPGAVSFTQLGESSSLPGSYMSGDSFFVYKFSKQQAGLAGLAFDEGQFGVFGYVTRGLEAAYTLESKDVIRSARVISGEDRLVRPA